MGATPRQVGVEADVSITSVVPLVGVPHPLPPPETRILPGRYIAAEPNVTGLEGRLEKVPAPVSMVAAWPASGSKTQSLPSGSRNERGYPSSWTNELLAPVNLDHVW